MSAKKTGKPQVKDEYYQKASGHRQWNERAYENIDDWEFDKKEIIELKAVLAESYKIPANHVTHELKHIDNEEDDDRDDYLNCIIYMKSYKDPSGLRQIFSRKVKIPEHMKQQAMAAKLEKAANMQTQN
jgi:hypothetical protein